MVIETIAFLMAIGYALYAVVSSVYELMDETKYKEGHK